MRVLFSYKGRKKNGRVAGEFVVIAVLKMLESQQQRENSAAGAGTPLKNHMAGLGGRRAQGGAQEGSGFLGRSGAPSGSRVGRQSPRVQWERTVFPENLMKKDAGPRESEGGDRVGGGERSMGICTTAEVWMVHVRETGGWFSIRRRLRSQVPTQRRARRRVTLR